MVTAPPSVQRVLDDVHTAASMPRVTIVLSRGAPSEERLLESFTAAHPRYRVVGRKSVGAAVLGLDEFDDDEDYLRDLRYARRRVRRARRLGCTVEPFDPEERRDELFTIRTSLPERQGRPMDAEFLDRDAELPGGPHIEYLGVFRDGALVAYGQLEYAGEVVLISDVFGHGDHLDDGVMFLLVAGVVGHVKRHHAEVRYALYDMYFGAGPGLRTFKTHVGFQPHLVRWVRDPRVATDGRRTRAPSQATAVARRIHHDYLARPRLDELHALLSDAVRLGYETMTLSAFADRVAAGTPDAGDRILLLRHDVDGDLPRARRMWDIERELGLKGTWFFRRCTWDAAFMRRLAAAGNEVGYHYEELATLIKERGAGTPEEARELVGDARDRLEQTLFRLRAVSGLDLDVLASHGDFANRAVGVTNVELLADADFRRRVGVRLEAYDIEPRVGARSADDACPGPWRPEDPAPALRRGEPVVEVLLHPRGWGRAPLANGRADLERIVDGLRYGGRRARRRREAAR